MNTDILHTISLKSDEKLVIEKNIQLKQPNYYRIGNGTMNKHKIQSINLVRESNACTKPAQHVIDWIMEGMVFDPNTEKIKFVIKLIPDTNPGKQILKKGYKELFEKDLVRRVKRSHYMLNPNAIQTNYKEQQIIWNTCNKQQDLEEM